MKYFKIKYLSIALFVVFGVSACNVFEVDKITDPNNPNSDAVLSGATRTQLQNLVNGLEASNRDIAGYWRIVGSFGRESYYLFASDSRSCEVWLQYPSVADPAEEDHSLWGGVGSTYGGPYNAVRQANLVILAVQNTDKVSETEAKGYIGFAKTIKGYQLLMPLMTQYTNGIRIALPYANPLEPGPFLSFDDALATIRQILDEGAQALQNAGSAFSFTLTSGFDGFDTPAGMLKMNRAIAARAALYAKDWPGVLDALNGSFLNLNASTRDGMWAGPANVYTGGLDATNPLYYKPNRDDALLVVVHPGVIADAEPGDLRVENKFFKRDAPAISAYIPYTESDLPPIDFEYQIALYDELTAPIPFIRNEELILMYAEAKAQTNQLQDAVVAINQIRTTWELSSFSSTSKSEIIDQMLHERRYSLWMEGHRWIDMRRYDRLDEINTSYDGGRVVEYIGRPQGERDWECYVHPELERCQ